MKCAKCGKRIKKDDQFCGFCGALVVREHKGKVWTKRILLFVMLLIILAVGCVYAVKKYFSNQHISVYSNGDRVYHPQSDYISWDQETGILYYDNLVTVYLKDNISNREEKELAKQIDGKIVTRIHGGVDLIQIKIETADYKKIIDYVSKLKESKYVQNAFYEAPWLDVESYKNKTKEDQNPWSEDGKTIEGKNGETPDGNDWWAEEIGTYSAWKYVDSHKDDLSEITVGIIDNGFDTEHEDLQNTKDSNKIHPLKEYEKNSAADHGTHVMGIIGANNNTKGIRGIADLANISYADWTPVTEDSGSKAYLSLLSTGEYVRITDKMIQQESVINNSWGSTLRTEETYKESDLYKILQGESTTDVSYEEYYQAYRNGCDIRAENCIELLMSYELQGMDKYLIVQAAGNGDSSGKGVDAIQAGCYANITEEVYEKYLEELGQDRRNQIERAGITYQDIKDNLLIVGAVEKTQENNECKRTEYSNYGKSVDLYAPGGTGENGIFSTVTLKDDKNENNHAPDGKKYATMEGTSMAAPMVTGSAALLWQIAPELSAAEVKQLLIDTSVETQTVSENEDGAMCRMLNVGNAVSYLAIEKALHEKIWRTESDGTRLYQFEKSGRVYDVTKKIYGFSDEVEDIGSYENISGVIKLNLEDETKALLYGQLEELQDTILAKEDGSMWFNEDLYEKYKEEDVFYQILTANNYPLILLPFDDEIGEADSKTKDLLVSSYWKYMSENDADLIFEEFDEDGNVEEYSWELSGKGTDIGEYRLSGDTLLFLRGDNLYRLKYEKTADIKDEMEKVFGADSGEMSDYIFGETDSVPYYFEDEAPMYLLPVEKMEQNEAYRQVIEEKEESYGSYELHTSYGIQYASGVCYLELRDVDQDGVEELYLVHNSNIMSTSVVGDLDALASYGYELWGYRKGCAVQLDTGTMLFSNGGWPSVCWAESQGKSCLVTASESSSIIYEIHGVNEDGDFGLVKKFQLGEGSGECYINDQQVTIEEWGDEINQYLENSDSVNLYYQNEDTVYEKLQKVKEQLKG